MPELCLHGRVAILGSGREGLSAYRYIDALGTAADLQLITEGLSQRPGEADLVASGKLQLSRLEDAGLEQFDLLIRSPGISPYRPPIQAAIDAGVSVTTPSSLWFQAHPAARTIAVTGTKGKSTTASLLAHLMAKQGLSVQLAGNIGTPLLDCSDQAVDWWVIELSSYQLADLQGQPTLGVLLNLASDHVDWHGGEARYRADKLRLAELVKSGGLLANAADPGLREALAGRDDVAWFEVDELGRQCAMPPRLPGAHNRVNLAACLAVLKRVGGDSAAALTDVESYTGLPHRLQFIGAVGGVDIIDDSISSAPVATVAAMSALQGRKVVLLVGGLDRGVDWRPYAEALAAHPPAAVVTLPDNGPQILRAIENAGIRPELGTSEARDLQEGVERARALAPEGGVILLSPGAPSFPHFRDFEDRGRQFARHFGLEAEQVLPDALRAPGREGYERQ